MHHNKRHAGSAYFDELVGTVGDAETLARSWGWPQGQISWPVRSTRSQSVI